MQAVNRVVKNTGILYARMAITVFISLYATRLILNGLGVIDFGIFNLVAGAIAMLTFLNTAMAAASQRFMSFAEGAGDFSKLRSIFNVSVVLHIIIAVLVLLVLEGVGYFLFNGILTIPEARLSVTKLIFQFMIISTLFTIISVPYDAVINAHENMLLVAILSIVEALFKLAIALYITYTQYDKLIVYGLFMAALTVLLLVIKRIYCHKKYPECEINIQKHFNRPVFKEMTSFAGWSFLGSSTSVIANYGQGIVMNMFFGTAVNAAQGISAQVSGQLGTLAVTMLKALNPIIDKSEGSGNRSLMMRMSITGSKVSFFLLLLFYVPVLLEMPYIFNLWLKSVPPFLIIFCRLLLIRNLIEQLGITLNSSILAVGNIRRYQVVSSVVTFFPLPFTFILFKLGYPAYFLYIVFLIYALITFTQIIYFAKKYCGLSITIYIKDVILKCILLLLLLLMISFIPYITMPSGLLRLFIISITNTVALIVGIWFIGLSFEERLNIENVEIKFFQKIFKRQLIN